MKVSLIGVGLLALSSVAGICQAAPGYPATVNQRRENQQDRIAQGVRSGQLTVGETSRLERREASINREDRSMRRADNGRLTRGDRVALNHRLNHTSRAIYRDKHNRARQ
jgi:hypothetical protein